jgi:uncharacterized protein (UPF0548 family)
MLFLRKPTSDDLQRYLASQAESEFSYPAVGATGGDPPAGFTVDHMRIKLGGGEATFNGAKRALQSWEHFRLGWLHAWPSETPIQAGQNISVLARAFGLWTLNFCRIVYAIDDEGPNRKYGFAYGTLHDHVERGEERFMIEWNCADNGVWYDVLAFSRPKHILAWLGYPLVRRTQKRFARDSAAAMLRAVQLVGFQSTGGLS